MRDFIWPKRCVGFLNEYDVQWWNPHWYGWIDMKLRPGPEDWR